MKCPQCNKKLPFIIFDMLKTPNTCSNCHAAYQYKTNFKKFAFLTVILFIINMFVFSPLTNTFNIPIPTTLVCLILIVLFSFEPVLKEKIT